MLLCCMCERGKVVAASRRTTGFCNDTGFRADVRAWHTATACKPVSHGVWPCTCMPVRTCRAHHHVGCDALRMQSPTARMQHPTMRALSPLNRCHRHSAQTPHHSRSHHTTPTGHPIVRPRLSSYRRLMHLRDARLDGILHRAVQP